MNLRKRCVLFSKIEFINLQYPAFVQFTLLKTSEIIIRKFLCKRNFRRKKIYEIYLKAIKNVFLNILIKFFIFIN